MALTDRLGRPLGNLRLSVTDRCNLRCEYCNCPYIDPTNLDLGRIEVMFDRLHGMGIRRLGLAGGEPLLRADLPDIVALPGSPGGAADCLTAILGVVPHAMALIQGRAPEHPPAPR